MKEYLPIEVWLALITVLFIVVSFEATKPKERGWDSYTCEKPVNIVYEGESLITNWVMAANRSEANTLCDKYYHPGFVARLHVNEQK